MKLAATIFLLMHFVTPLVSQQRFFLYSPEEKVTIEGLESDKLPPYMDFFKADSANGSAILICPGGGYTHLADKHEGVDVAKYYNRFGFDCFVLHYRLNNSSQKGHRFPDQYNDVTTALRLAKSKASELKFDPERLGILGFSAGGHLASMGATMHVAAERNSKVAMEQWGSRPAFAILIYPVIDFSGKLIHQGSRDMLLGKDPGKGLVDSLSTQNRVNRRTPPTFIVYSVDDKTVPVENGVLFFEALKRNGVPVSLHIFDHGGHGYGMAPDDKVINTWPELSVKWLERLGYK